MASGFQNLKNEAAKTNKNIILPSLSQVK